MATTTEEQPIIFLDDISVTFKTRTGSIFKPNKVHAVQNVSLKLMPGETIGIVGESGCGKSTTANVMCGLSHQRPVMCTSREWMLPSVLQSSESRLAALSLLSSRTQQLLLTLV